MIVRVCGWVLAMGMAVLPAVALPAQTESAPVPADRIGSASFDEGDDVAPSAVFHTPELVERLRTAAATWSRRPAFAAADLRITSELSLNSHGTEVGRLKNALVALGYLTADEADAAEADPVVVPGSKAPAAAALVYDEATETAVKAAQADFGLEQDGKVGPQLLANLTADPSATALDFERWAAAVERAAQDAWDQGNRKIVLVNIPSFTLHALNLETGETEVESRVIIGMPTRRTPRFATNIVGLQYNPAWYPPPSLVKLGRHYMPPGPANPLGVLLFVTDNTQNIFLHDTDEHELFERGTRALSSGCVRVQQWQKLATFVSGWDAARIQASIDTRATRTDKLPPVPVLTTYSLVDAVEGGAGRRVNIYALDEQP